MTVGILSLVIFIHSSCSLKDKRMVLYSLKAKLRNNFNVAVSEIGDENKWQKATLAIVGAEKNRNNMNGVLSRVINFLEKFHNIVLINYEMEFI